jgi:DNA-binding MarR family transcriptional regulator
MSERKKIVIDANKATDTPLAFIFSRLAKNYYGAAAKHFEELDMERNFFVLNLISKNQPTTQQCLSNCLQIDKASIVRVIDYLSDKGLVKREVSPDDRREHHIVVTKKAANYVAKISAGFNELNQKAFKGFTKQEKEFFYTMIEKMQGNLSELPAREFSVKYTKK